MSAPDPSLSPLQALQSLVWDSDHVTFGDIDFRLEEAGVSKKPSSSSGITLYKSRGFIRNYERLLTNRSSFRPKRILELGIWGGGSVVLWNEVFHPDRVVALDILPDQETAPLRSYIDSRAKDAIVLHWQVSQDDVDRLREIIASDFRGEPPDFVIDDASHAYGPTRSSFETLFPLMEAGSIYIIEDWRSSIDSPGQGTPLHQIASDLVATLASGPSPIAAINVQRGILVIERGRHAPPAGFTLTSPTSPSGFPDVAAVRSTARRLLARTRRG